MNGESFIDLPIPDVTNLTRDGLRRTLDQALEGEPMLERLVTTENDGEGGDHMALSLARVSPENSSDLVVVEVVDLAS